MLTLKCIIAAGNIFLVTGYADSEEKTVSSMHSFYDVVHWEMENMEHSIIAEINKVDHYGASRKMFFSIPEERRGKSLDFIVNECVADAEEASFNSTRDLQ